MTATRTPVTAATARDLLSAALHAWPANCDRHRLIGGAIESLDRAATDLEYLDDGIHWSAVYPWLSDSLEPEYEAGQLAAQNLADAVAGVRDVFAQAGIILAPAGTEKAA